MAKHIPDATLDAMLDVTEGTELFYCSAQPTNYTEASSTYKLADAAISGANYAAANGDTSGRKNTITPPTGTAIDTTGTCTHVAICSGGTTLRLVTTCTSQALTSGGTVTGNAFDHELGDPT